MTGADFLQLDRRQAPPGGLAAWLADQLRAAIADGRLPVGTRLPATRVLAVELAVSRGVITEAYQRLVDDGRVEGRRGGGSVVVSRPAAVVAPAGTGAPDQSPPDGARSPARELAERLHPDPAADARPVDIDLFPGVPDLAAFPRAAWLRAEREVLAAATSRSFGYPSPQGVLPLRTELSRWLARTRGIAAEPSGLIVVSGVAQALALTAQLLVAAGHETVAVEDPGSAGARNQFVHWGLATPPIPVDGQGLIVSELAAGSAGAVLVTPAHHFPVGVVLGPQRRRELLGWASSGGLVIEDDYDAEHRYDRPPVPALAGMGAVGATQVLYTGSVSKSLAPAMRLGWIVAPARFREELIERKRAADLGSPALGQLALAELMSSGQLERHLRTVRRRHRQRRDAMVGALARHLPGAPVHGVAAGLHLLVELPGGVADTEVAAAALEVGVRVQPLSWHRQQPGWPGLVLGYAATRPDAIVEAIARIGRLITARHG